MRRDDKAQVHVIEAIIVGVLVFVAIAIAAVFRVPTITGTFEQSELERLGADVLLHLAAIVPVEGADCNEPGPCPFETELDRMVSLALRYQGATPLPAGAAETRDVSPLADYFNQSLPDGARYVIKYSNGVNATRIFPANLNPPALDVVVAHAFIAPNWMQYSQQAAASALIQIGEVTGFTTGATAVIRDPLNRDREEWGADGGRTHASLLSDALGTKAVPPSAVYGTHQHCSEATCATPTYFTVVPPGVYGAGSSILRADRDNSTSVVLLAADIFTVLKFTDHTTPDNLLSTGERLYLDLNNPAANTVSAGDLRLTDMANCVGARPCISGTFVKVGDADVTATTPIETFPVSPRPTIRALLGDGDGVLEEGESIYLDAATASDTTGDRMVGQDDRRLSRVATFRSGSEVSTSGPDFDVGRALGAPADEFTGVRLYFGDTDQDGSLDPEEAIYLDLVGNGQSAGLESFDLRLSPLGSPNLRYTYDVQVVIWFGI